MIFPACPWVFKGVRAVRDSVSVEAGPALGAAGSSRTTAPLPSALSALPGAFLLLAVLCFAPFPALGQTATPDPAPASETTDENDAIRASLSAITSMLDAQAAKRQIANSLRQAIENAETEIDKKDLGAKLTAVNGELAKLEDQIVSLATGVSENELNPVDEKFELQDELEQLIRPFVWILKSATENARQIEQLKRTLLEATEKEQTATEAIARIKPMIAAAPGDGVLHDRLQTILQDWEARRVTAKDLAVTVRQQLRSRLSEKVDPSDAAGRAFTTFFSDRGRNLFFGVVAFSVIVVVMRLLKRGFMALLGASRNRAFPVRLGALVYDVLTVGLAFGTTIAIFNYYNDWFLTGVMLIVFITIGWLILKSLPSLFEQVTLLLNLGAVQEGERVVLNNVPWLVTRLDLYTELENPTLRGGQYTVPVRELKGLHSRPMDGREKWFPSDEGDWVVLDNGLWAEVILQSPESVHLREEGGAVTHFTTPAYLDQNPKNVSHAFRATVEFGLDYAHQSDAAETIPSILQAYVDERIRDTFGSDKVLGTYVTLFRAGESSLDFEIEVDVGRGMGHIYETIHHKLIRLAVECCTENGWTIPFPQLTVHRTGG